MLRTGPKLTCEAVCKETGADVSGVGEQVLRRSGTPQEQVWAARIEPVRSSCSRVARCTCTAVAAPSLVPQYAVLSRPSNTPGDCYWKRRTCAPLPAVAVHTCGHQVPLLVCAQVVRRPHFLLVTLVLCNAACTEVRSPGERRRPAVPAPASRHACPAPWQPSPAALPR